MFIFETQRIAAAVKTPQLINYPYVLVNILVQFQAAYLCNLQLPRQSYVLITGS